jgi:hypothetical protein
VKITPKFVFFRTATGVQHRISSDQIKLGGVASLQFTWYTQRPVWPTEGQLGEMYAELHRLKETREATYRAHQEASDRVWKMQDAIRKYERTGSTEAAA